MSTQKPIGNFTYDTFVGIDGVTGQPYSSINPMPVSASVTPPSDYVASGSITAANANLSNGTATAGSTVVTATLNGVSTADINVSGTFSETLIAQISVDSTNWVTLPTITKISDGSTAATITASGAYQVPIPAAALFRITASAYVSGTAVVAIRASTGVSATSSGGSSSVQYAEGATAATATGNVILAKNGTTVNALQTDASKNLLVNLQTAIPAGTNLIGKTGIDQTTPGTTNKVSIGTDGTVAINTALPAGSNSIGTVVATVAAASNSTSTALESTRSVKGSAGTLFGVNGYNSNASTQYIFIYNATSATGTPFSAIKVSGGSNFSIDYGDLRGRTCSTGIFLANSTTAFPTYTAGASDCFFDAQYL